jgi:hypothetical protein
MREKETVAVLRPRMCVNIRGSICAERGRPGLSAVARIPPSLFELRREGGRDPMKIAQYEVLGIMQKEVPVPLGTIEMSRLPVLSYAASPA